MRITDIFHVEVVDLDFPNINMRVGIASMYSRISALLSVSII